MNLLGHDHIEGGRNLSPEDAHFKTLQAMTQWVSAIADNIRNPLAGISAALDIVTREMNLRRETGVCNEQLIDDACQRMRHRFVSLNEYVRELVDFGRPLTLTVQPIHLASWLPSLLSRIEGDERSDASNLQGLALCGGQLSYFIGDGVSGAQVAWDAQRVGMAVRTLITNAIEAAFGQKTPRVHVLVEKVASELFSFYGIHVEDNGPGFDPQLGDSVFEPFFSTKEAGTGLGLSIARRYAQAHGGSVTIGRSSLLGGARVTLLLPCVVNESSFLQSQ
jgi:signal transduction histidine kinase